MALSLPSFISSFPTPPYLSLLRSAVCLLMSLSLALSLSLSPCRSLFCALALALFLAPQLSVGLPGAAPLLSSAPRRAVIHWFLGAASEQHGALLSYCFC